METFYFSCIFTKFPPQTRYGANLELFQYYNKCTLILWSLLTVTVKIYSHSADIYKYGSLDVDVANHKCLFLYEYEVPDISQSWIYCAHKNDFPQGNVIYTNIESVKKSCCIQNIPFVPDKIISWLWLKNFTISHIYNYYAS